MSDPHPETLIEAYLAGDLPPSDAERVRAFVEATPSRRGFVAGIRAAVHGEDVAEPRQDIETAVRALMGRVRGDWVGEVDPEVAVVGAQPRQASARQGGIVAGHPLPRRASRRGTLFLRALYTLFDELPGRAMALFERKDAKLRPEELKRLRDLVARKTQDEP